MTGPPCISGETDEPHEAQLTFDGREVERPAHHRLTERQHDVLRVLRASEQPMATRTIGRLYVDASGALGRLEALGLIERVRRGWWRAT